jgi:hypothetical protein
MVVIVIMIMPLMIAGTMQRGKGRSDLHNLRLATEHRFQLRQVIFQAHAGYEIGLRSFRRREILRLRLKTVRVTLFPDEIHHLHLFPTHLPQQIADQRVQRGYFQLRRLGKSQRSEKHYRQQTFRVHGDNLKRFLTNASILR